MSDFKITLSRSRANNRMIIALFSILPLIDTLNGIYSDFPIGSVYKIFLCLVLLLCLLKKKQGFKRNILLNTIAVICYILFTMLVNVAVFEGEIITMDFPIKLIFNVCLMGLLLENHRARNLQGEDFYKILNLSSWVLIACFLIPYLLGIGNRVYGNEIGYKAFFISQNELSLILIVLCFFCIYKMTIKFQWAGMFQLLLLVLCSMLLNTKSAIVACIAGVAVWLLTIALKGNYKIKLLTIVTAIIGCFALKETVFSAVDAMIMRFSALQSKHYGGSVVTAILSGRNYYFDSAWKELNENHPFFRMLFGNGFCSEYLVEMDLIDIFFYLGIVGSVIVIAFWIYVLVKSMPNLKKDGNIIRLFSYVVIIGFMNFTGHVMFMAMSGCFFMVYCCFLLTYSKENVNKQVEK